MKLQNYYLLLLLILVVAGITSYSIYWSNTISLISEEIIPEEILFEKEELPQEEKEVSEEATTTEPIDTSDWKTYRNEEYGFEVKYPSDWKYRDWKYRERKSKDSEYLIVVFGKQVPAQDYPFTCIQRFSKQEVIGTMFQKNSLILDIHTWGPGNPEEYVITQQMLSTFRFVD